MRNLLILLITIVLFAGCWNQRIGDFSVISSRNFDLNSDYVLLEKGVTGEDTQYIIIFIPTGQINIENAVDDALKRVDGDVMTNATIKLQGFYIPYIYGESRYVVEGDVWKKSDAKIGDVINKIDDAYTAVNKNGEIVLEKHSQK
jgi:hypothetical protein